MNRVKKVKLRLFCQFRMFYKFVLIEILIDNFIEIKYSSNFCVEILLFKSSKRISCFIEILMVYCGDKIDFWFTCQLSKMVPHVILKCCTSCQGRN